MTAKKKLYIKVSPFYEKYGETYSTELWGVFDFQHMMEDKNTYIDDAEKYFQKMYDNYNATLLSLLEKPNVIDKDKIEAEAEANVCRERISYLENLSGEQRLETYLSHINIEYIEIDLNKLYTYGISIV